MDLIDEEDSPVLLLQLLDHLLEALLEVPAELRPRKESAHVQRVDPRLAKRFGNLSVHDPLRKSLRDGRLSHTGLAHVDRVVLEPPAEDLDGSLEDLFPADERVNAAAPRFLRQVHRVRLEGASRPPLLPRPGFLLGGFLSLLWLLGLLCLSRRVDLGEDRHAMRYVGEERQAVDPLAGKEVRRVGFLFLEHGNEDLVDLNGVLVRGGAVKNGRLHDGLEPRRLDRLGVIDNGNPCAEELLDVLCEGVDVSSTGQDDLLAAIEKERGIENMLGGQVLVAPGFRLPVGGKNDVVQLG